MRDYDATEQAYRNGYVKGLEDGSHQEEFNILAKIERTFGERCVCGEHYLLHHNYCPHCGMKLWQENN